MHNFNPILLANGLIQDKGNYQRGVKILKVPDLRISEWLSEEADF